MPLLDLHAAVASGRAKAVKKALERNVFVDDRDDCGQTPLVKAVFVTRPKPREKIIRMLLKEGASPSTPDATGRGALHWACLYGLNNEVDCMLKHVESETEIGMHDNKGCNALFYAAKSGDAATVKLLVDRLDRLNINLNIANIDGVTPYMQAVKFGHDICASIIRNAIMFTTDPASSQEIKKSFFPPILSPVIVNRIKFLELKAEKCRGAKISLDCENENDTECVYSGAVSPDMRSELSSLDSIRDDSSSIVSRRRKQSSARPRAFNAWSTSSFERPQAAVTMERMTSRSRKHGLSLRKHDSLSSLDTSSTDSDNDINDQTIFIPTKHLHKLYKLYEGELCESFRPTAREPTPIPLFDKLCLDASKAEETCPTPITRNPSRIKKKMHSRVSFLKCPTRAPPPSRHTRDEHRYN